MSEKEREGGKRWEDNKGTQGKMVIGTDNRTEQCGRDKTQRDETRCLDRERRIEKTREGKGWGQNKKT